MNIDKKLKNNIKLDYISCFVKNLNMQGAIWVLYLAYCGLNLAEIGLVEGIYHATSILCEIPSGAAADLLGRRRCMILSRICFAVSCVIMLFANGFFMFALSFIIQAVGNNLNSGSEEALVYDSMKAIGEEERYISVYGKLNVILEVAQQIATVAGGVLAEYSFRWCYIASCVIAVLALVPVLLMTEAPFERENEAIPVGKLVATHFKKSFEILKTDVRILKIIAFYSVVFSGYTLLYFYSQQYYSQMGYNKIQISLIMLIAGVASCAGALFSDKLFRKLGDKLEVIAAFLIVFAFVCDGFGSVAVSVVAFAAAGFGNAVLYPVQSEALNALIPSEQRATLISVDSMCFSIAMIILFPLAGAMADAWGLGMIFVVIGLLLGIFIVWHRARK